MLVYLAQPEGLGSNSAKEKAGPTVGPSAVKTPLLHHPALQAGLGKLLGLLPEIHDKAQHQN